MNILAVDDKQINNKVIELDVEEFMDENEIENYHFHELGSGKDALEFINNNHVDLIFLDIMMPNMSGIEVLEKLNELDKNIKVIMVTALNDNEVKKEALNLGADGYICKPFDYQEIHDVLENFILERSKNQDDNTNEDEEDDDFFDFDEDDEFLDFDEEDDEDSLHIQKDMMTQFNESHKNVSAEEFLNEYNNIEYLLDDLEDIELDVYEHIETLFEDNLAQKKESIIDTIEMYARFLNTFEEFQELSTALNFLSRILDRCDFEQKSKKESEVIAIFIRTILEDLVKWKNKVFVEQTAVDVFYLNASLLNSCIQLQSLLEK